MSSSRVVELEFLGLAPVRGSSDHDRGGPNTSQQKLMWLIRHSWTIIPWARGPREKQVKRSVKHIDDQLKNFAVRLGADESLNIPQLPCLFVSNFISGKH